MISGYADTSFLATIGSQTHTPSNPIVFDVAFLNSGGHYNATTGIFTVPIDGTYEFIVHILGDNDFEIRVHLIVDGTYVSNLVDEDKCCKKSKIREFHIYTNST